jgi:sulfur-oxidizing protein SoxA
MKRKIGQLNMACVDCHSNHANKCAAEQYLVHSKATIAHFPTWRDEPWRYLGLRKRFQWCNVSVRANELRLMHVNTATSRWCSPCIKQG